MSTVFLSRVDSASKLDSYTGLPLPPDDGLSSTKSTPLLLQVGVSASPRDKPRRTTRSPLLNEVLHKSTSRISTNYDMTDSSPGCRPTSSLSDLEGLEEEGELQCRSSFVHLLQNRDLEMDQTWMDTQKSTFANWLNDRLKGGRHGIPKVTDLSADLRDGTLLIKLLENLTKKKIRGYTKNPKMPAHKLVNLDLAIEFMKKEDIKLIGIGSVNIFEGNIKLTLGMLWTLIQKYQLRMKGYKVSTKDVMFQWLQALLPSWNITNFTSDWADGRALLAIINAIKPGIAPSVATLDPTKHRGNCILATQVAAVHLKVPKIIDADNLASGNIDELSMITYLSYFVEPAQAKLKKWVKRALPHSSITNFTSNWFDGILLSALLNSCFPGTMPQWMKMTKGNANENVTEFYDICSKKLGFEPHFNAHDLTAGKVEELQVMTLIMQIQNSELKSMPEAVIVSGPGLEHAKIGKETHFYINTTEAGPGELYIDSYYEDGKRIKFKLKEKVSGILTLTYAPTAPGQIVFDILWADVPVPNSPFSVLAMDSSIVQILDFENHSKLRDVGKTINLKLGMKQSTRVSVISAHLAYSNGDKIEVRVTGLDGTTALLEYRPPRAGRPVLHVFLSRRELTHLAVTYNVVDSGGYVIRSLPESRIYQTFEDASFSIESSKNLPLEVLQITAILTSDIQFPIRFKSVEGNRGYASFKPTLPGIYQVEVVCVNTLIQGTPFTIQVSDPLSCKLHGILPSHLEINKPHIFQLDTKAEVDSIEFECIDRDVSSCFVVECGHNKGEYFTELKVSPTTEGEFTVGIKFHGKWISSSPFRVVVCNPSKFQVKGDIMDKKMVVVGQTLRFRVELTQREAIDESLIPVVRASGPSAKYTPKYHLSEDRRALISQFTPYEIGTHEVSVTYGGFHIPSSPLLVAVIAFDSHTFSATGSGLQEAFTNIPSQFVILTKRTGLVENGTLYIRIAGVVNGTECRVRIKDNNNGSYNVAYLITVPGAYLVTVQAGGAHIPGSPFKLNVQPGPNASKCIMYGSALKENEILTIGQPIDFTVDATSGGVGKLAVKAVGPGGVLARVFTAKDSSLKGMYDIKLDPIRHGKYRVSVKWSGTDIPGSPFIIKVFPGVDASKCQAYGPGLEDGSVGSVTSFTIETRDAGPGTLKVGIHGVKDAFKIDIKPKDLQDVRTLVARYFPRKPGDYLISITWSDKHIPGSPFKVTMVGEALEENFHQYKYKPMPRMEELQVIEEDENEEDSFLELDTDFEVSSVVSRIKESKPVTNNIPSTTSLDETVMPSFGTAISRQGYKDAFVHNRKKNYRASKSLSHLDQDKMMTFSGLSQPSRSKKHKRAVTPPRSSGPKSGAFQGQATIHMDTKDAKKNQ